MIDLSQTRARMLAQIEAPDPAGDFLHDLTDPRVATADAHIHLRGYGRTDLFPLLHFALVERFVGIPRPHLIRDLLMPLKNALGNAFKHGNGGDPAKSISVEMVLTRKGAFIAVTNEGAGFDAALTFRRFQEQQQYFANHGCGFRNLHRARSTVSYENGGRTLLLCFRPEANSDSAPSSSPERAAGARLARCWQYPDGGTVSSLEVQSDTARQRVQMPASESEVQSDWPVPWQSLGGSHPLPNVLDAEWILSRLSSEVPEFHPGRVRIECCRAYPTSVPGDEECGNRYLLRISNDEGRLEMRILTGRLHATESAAAADYEAARRLHESNLATRVRIPRPIARLVAEPRLVLYDFDPWMNLWEYQRHRRSPKALRHSAERIGQTLACLHESQIAFGDVKSDPAGDGLQAMVARAEKTLKNLRAEAGLANRFWVCAERILERSAFSQLQASTPIHGEPGWHRIHYGIDGFFYLFGFETCRGADPGLDLGGFAADLLSFTLADNDAEAFGVCVSALLNHYNSNANHPFNQDDLGTYIALALCERIKWEHVAKTNVEPLLAALNFALSDTARAVANAAL